MVLLAELADFWLIIKTWWWLILPFILYFPAKTLYLWWLRWEVWYRESKNEWILLEIVPPGEILKPFRAMEDIFSLLWGIIDVPNWRERNCLGEIPLGGGLWFSFEIASIGGKIHFFLRVPKIFQKTAESAIYSHYPETEISEVPDYTQNVPQNVPNKTFDLLGEDIHLERENFYPIKTYSAFFEERPETVKEEKRIDPFDSLMEHMARLQSDEQIWLQIVTNPITNKLIPWVDRGKEMASKIARRPAKQKPKSMIGEAIDIIFGKKPAEAAKEKGLPPGVSEEVEREMLITPGERTILTALENKIARVAYQVWIRAIYIYRKDKPYFSGNYKIARSYFNHFSTLNLNYIKYWNKTRTRIHYLFRKRRLYARKKNIFRRYVQRFPPKYPNMRKGTHILNVEELATIFHFPMEAAILPPSVPRIEAKKGGPPPSIPTG